MALYFECQININALIQNVFLAILPTGINNEAILTEYFTILYHNLSFTQRFVFILVRVFRDSTPKYFSVYIVYHVHRRRSP